MPAITTRPLEDRDTSAAAALLAAAYREYRERQPLVAQHLTETEGARAAIEKQLTGAQAAGVVAVRDATVVGFAIGETRVSKQDSYMSQLGSPRSATIALHGHALAADEDPVDVYRLLYRDLSKRWVAEGFFDHTVHVMHGDAAVQEAWVNLGFGRHATAAVRDVSLPVDAGESEGIEVHQAGDEDVEVLVGLFRHQAEHHMSAPMYMFWPSTGPAGQHARDYLKTLLEDAGNPHFVAYDGSTPLGLVSFLSQGFIPEAFTREGNLYLFMGIVALEHRRGGVGRQLLARGMAWAREHAFTHCTLHVLSANYAGAPFWFGNGFVPIEHGMERHIDERVLWAAGAQVR